VQREIRDTTWDEGVISEFMQRASGTAYDTPSGHTLLLFATADEESELGYRLAGELETMLSWLGVTRRFNVLLWWRDDPRRIEADEWPTKRNVNGGWTRAGSSTICVYRSEEWDRVVFHEMIHALEWDWKMPQAPLPCWGLGDASNTSPALFEAWTELYAEWLWSAWTGVSWARQRRWQNEQAVQILARHARRGGTWDEDTSVFAYYILKAALAPHVEFLLLFQNGDSGDERQAVLCSLAAPELEKLRRTASRTMPRSISLRMTVVEK
jgi:hypothetical protein